MRNNDHCLEGSGANLPDPLGTVVFLVDPEKVDFQAYCSEYFGLARLAG